MLLTRWRQLAKRSPGAHRRASCRPQLELLEERLTPLTWTGKNSSSWSDPGNWSPARIPSQSSFSPDDLLFPSNAIGFTSTDDLTGAPAQIDLMDFRASGFTVNATGSNSISLDGEIVSENLMGMNTVALPMVLMPGLIPHIVIVQGGGKLIVSGSLSSGGSPQMLQKQAGGQLVLSGLNSYNAATIVDGGTLQLGSSAAVPSSSAVSVSLGATFDLNGFSPTIGSLADGSGGGGSVTLGSGTLRTGGNNTSTTFSGVISGGGGLTKIGTATMTLNGNENYAGPTSVSGGTLRMGSSGYLSPASNVSVAAGASLDMNNTYQAIGSLADFIPIHGNASGGSILLGSGFLFCGNSNASATFSGVISGSGGLVKYGTGTQTFKGANTYSGGTTLTTGSLSVGNSSALGTGTLALYGGTLQASTTITLANTFTVVLPASIGGSNSLTLTGAGSLAAGNTLTVGNTATTTLAGVLSGPGALTVAAGTGTVLLSAANTYTGVTTVNSGTLRVGNSSALGTGRLALGGGTLQASAPVTLANAFTVVGLASIGGSNSLTLTDPGALAAGTTLTVGNTATTTFAGILSGPGALTVAAGTGTVLLSAANTYTGPTTVNSGTLRVGAANAVPSASDVLVAGGARLDLNNASDTIGSLAGAGTVTLGSGTLTCGGNNTSAAFSGIISGSGGLTQIGGGTQTLAGNNIYTGNTQVSGTGTLIVNGSQPGSNVTVLAGATLRGAGTVGTISNAGTVSPGETSTAILNGATTVFKAGSSLRVRLQGTNRGAGYDQVNVNGSVDLGGSPALNAALGFSSLPGDRFVIVQTMGGTIIGTFNGLPDGQLFTLDNARFQVHYTPQSVELIHVGDPATFFQLSAPASSQAGTAFDLTVTALDSGNNVDPFYTGTVHFSTSDPRFLLPADYTFTVGDHGVHSFAGGVTLLTAGSQTVTASDTSTPSVTGSVAVAVTPAPADHLSVNGAPTSTAGIAFDVTVGVQDAFNNTVTDYTGTVHFTTSDPTGGTLPVDYTFTAGDNGVHTFAGGATLFTAGSQTVTATDTVSGITGSASTTITPAAADHFLINVPSSATSGTPFDLTVTALDPFGNTDTNYQGTVTFTSSDSDPAVVLPAAYPFTSTDGGVHTFTDTGLGETTLITLGDQTVTATDTVSGITGTASVTVIPGPWAPPGGSNSPKDVLFSAAALSAEPVSGQPANPSQGMPATPTGNEASRLDAVNVDRLFASANGEGRRVPPSTLQRVRQDPVQECWEDSARYEHLFS